MKIGRGNCELESVISSIDGHYGSHDLKCCKSRVWIEAFGVLNQVGSERR